MQSTSHFPLVWQFLQRGNRSRPAALFLHGFTRTAASWPPVVGASDRDCLGVDLMGHGASPSPPFEDYPECYSMEYATDALRDVVRRIPLPRFHLVGYSMGGRLALHFALRHPDSLLSLALISANAGMEDVEDRERRRAADDALAERIPRIGLEAFVEEWLQNPALRSQTAPHARATFLSRKERESNSATGLAGSLRGMGQGAQPVLWRELGNVHVPTLVIAGRHDEKYIGIAREMGNRIPGSHVRIFENCGHDVPSDAPEELRDALKAFWRETDSIQQT